jgi:hypothetical protein
MEKQMKISLYQAAEQVRDLLDQIDPETGEMPEGFEQARAIVANKAQACAAFCIGNEAEADMVEAHAKALMERVKAARKRTVWLKTYLASHMAACGITSIKSDEGLSVKLELGRDESVKIINASQIDMHYLREVPATFEPDKALIKKALKEGHDVMGAELIRKDRLTIK